MPWEWTTLGATATRWSSPSLKKESSDLHEQGNFRKVISLETCLIASEQMVEAAMEVADWAKEHGLKGYDKETHEGLLRHLMVRQSFATGELMLGVFATEAPTGDLQAAVDDLKARVEEKFPHVKSLLWMENTALGRPYPGRRNPCARRS